MLSAIMNFFKFSKKNSLKEDLIDDLIKDDKFRSKNDFTEKFLGNSLVPYNNIDENIEYLNNLDQEEKKFHRFVAVSEDKQEKIKIHIGVISHLEVDERGILSPVFFDMVSGMLVKNVNKLLNFNLEAVEMMSKLNKGQYLSLFKMAHMEIDQEMESESELLKPIITMESISILKNNGFCNDQEKNVPMNYVRNYWDHSFDFNYETKIYSSEPSFNKNEGNVGLNQDKLADMINKKQLTLYISNENDEPELSVIFDVVYFGNNSQLPRAHMLVSNKENGFFGLPHYYSKTLVSCFKCLTKQDINALYFGIRKNDIDKEDRAMYTNYENFIKNINKGLENYNKYSTDTILKYYK